MADQPKLPEFRDEDTSDPGVAELTPKQYEDQRDAPAFHFLAQIENLLEDGRFGFARDTLEGIYKSVETSGHVTEGQRKAVDNIETSVENRSSRRSRFNSVSYRRY